MIIDWIKSLFHKKPDEIVKLKEIIEKQKQEKEQLQKERAPEHWLEQPCRPKAHRRPQSQPGLR